MRTTRITFDFERDCADTGANAAAHVVFDSATATTDITGSLYPLELKLVSALVQMIKETHCFTPQNDSTHR